MSAAWIRQQAFERSGGFRRASGVLYAMRFTVGSDIGMALELAIKSLAQGLSSAPDGDPQVLETHDLACLWREIPSAVQTEVERSAEGFVAGTFHRLHAAAASVRRLPEQACRVSEQGCAQPVWGTERDTVEVGTPFCSCTQVDPHQHRVRR